MISIAFIGICTLGFAYQVADLNAYYFQYQTMTIIDTDIERQSFAPDIHICPTTHEIFDFKAYQKHKQNIDNMTTVRIVYTKDIFRFQSTMKVKDLLEYSPLAEDMIKLCSLRRPKAHHVIVKNSTACVPFFNVTKYFTMENICYHIQPIPGQEDIKYDLYRMAYIIHYPGTFYVLRLTEAWDEILTFKVLSVVRNPGDKSAILSPTIFRGYMNGMRMYDLFTVSHSKMRHLRMPPPYDTMCRHYDKQGLGTQTGCTNSCMYKLCLEQLDRIWAGSRVYTPMDKLPVSRLDFRNETFSQLFEDIYVHCQEKCAQLECDMTWTLTEASREQYFAGTTFQVVVSRKPSFEIKHDALTTLQAYVIYLMSCVGSWFGLSVLSVNPASVVSQQLTRRQKYPLGGAVFSRTPGAVNVGHFIKLWTRRVSQSIVENHALPSPPLVHIEPNSYVAPPGVWRHKL
ncbi:hypothetical protein HDE_01914 [Halotydeus destructor]|nr:hypothetical protein HDE_01914 [Halotydeus destructor]